VAVKCITEVSAVPVMCSSLIKLPKLTLYQIKMLSKSLQAIIIVWYCVEDPKSMALGQVNMANQALVNS